MSTRVSIFMYYILTVTSIVIAFLSNATFNHVIPGAKNSPYWIQHWLISYSSGYRRRAFVGELASKIFSQNIDIYALTYVQWLISGVILIFFSLKIRDLFFLKSGAVVVIISNILIIGGPLGRFIFETSGDLLQIVILLLFGVLILSARLPRYVRVVNIVVCVVVCVLIHEAAVFIVIPPLVLLFLHFSAPQRIALSLMVPLACAVLIAIAFRESIGTPMMRVVDHQTGEIIAPSSDLTPNLMNMFSYEFFRVFGSLKNFSLFILQVISFSAVPVMVFGVLTISYNKIVDIFNIFVLSIISAAPLYVIAHDWGRFSAYTLMISLVTYAFTTEGNAIRVCSVVARLCDFLKEQRYLIAIALALASLSPVLRWHPYVIYGSIPAGILLLCIVFYACGRSIYERFLALNSKS